jgi:copper(I)-binding protein
MTYARRLFGPLLLVVLLGGQPHAQTAPSNIAVENAWARATPRGAKTGAVYLTLVNNGASDDRLLSATTPVADNVRFHKETEENGVARMRPLQSVALGHGGKVVFGPGDMHMMLVGLKQPLTEGQSVALTLEFEKSGKVEVTAPVAKIGAMEPATSPMTHGTDHTMHP